MVVETVNLVEVHWISYTKQQIESNLTVNNDSI